LCVCMGVLDAFLALFNPVVMLLMALLRDLQSRGHASVKPGGTHCDW